MMPKKIVLTPFPFTDLSSTKRRPTVVLSNRKPNSSDVIVAFVSSVITANVEETDFVLEFNHSDFGLTGLRKRSVLKWINWQH
ncbi:MAG: type II toxin-antitoxin system PemK/MazF family toxin [Saprospiraceae bacterium]|nr:type II toxin-antitoxin system PemK/MazF family toxin [Saprospiraceae bacterium]